MAETSVIILAAGEQKRWAAGGYKQLCVVDGETVIDRTIRQARETFRVEPRIAVRDKTNPFGFGLSYFYPSRFDVIIDTLESTKPLWSDTTVILLGDTFYPDIAMDIIYLKNFLAYGTKGEIYALKFSRGRWPLVNTAIQAAREFMYRGGKGKLWEMYRAYDGLPMNEPNNLGPNFYHFKDADSPTEFDRIEVYNSFLEKRRAYA